MLAKLELLKKIIVPENEKEHDTLQDEMHNIIKSFSPEQLKQIIINQNELEKTNKELQEKLTEKDKVIEILESTKKQPLALKDIELYNILNLHRFFKTEDGKLIQEGKKYNPFHYMYDENQTAYERNIKDPKLFELKNYQKKFIEEWSVSGQECVILYYGVGSGKTLIAVNCAEQFVELTKHSSVYFLLPASLILNTIAECYFAGIDPTRKHSNGKYVYNFVSYQQLLRAKFDFADNSLLIVDEAHNLRNIKTIDITEKVNARRREKTGNFTLLGNKLSERLIKTSARFLRRIFMTGTLFVNSPEDIEAIISIGYNKAPMLSFHKNQYENMIETPESFKLYYEGLISYFMLKDNNPRYPKKKYIIEPIKIDNNPFPDFKKDAYFVRSRQEGTDEKTKWIYKFLMKKRDDKTLIYSQFVMSLKPLMTLLTKRKIKFGLITGQLDSTKKMNIVKKYNDNEIKVLLFTLSIKEGISFKETNNIIIFEPYWNWAIMEQVLARGIRLNSHTNGNKSIINLYFLIAFKKNSALKKQWFNKTSQIMNNGIKKESILITPTLGEKKPTLIKPFDDNQVSRDIDLMNKMLIKQSYINLFEEKLLQLKRFEDVNNVENNEFIKLFNEEKIKYENKSGKPMNRKDEIKLRKDMYKHYYEKEIQNLNKKLSNVINFTRFDQEERYQQNKNPDIVQRADVVKYENKENELNKLIDNNASIEQIFSVFGIQKKDITQYQANFTPENHIKTLIEASGILNNTKDKIMVLEPTAGIGGVISKLVTYKEISNRLFIDCNEIHGLFYQIGKALFKDIDNIHWYNTDFMTFKNKYNYDYILGNPPFNISYQQSKIVKSVDKYGKSVNTVIKADVHFYDVNFVAYAYNLLNTGGVLSMIISDKLTRFNKGVYKRFNQYLSELKKINADNVKIQKIGDFKQDKGVAKIQTTKFGMVCITLKKVDNIMIDLQKEKRLLNIDFDNKPKKKKAPPKMTKAPPKKEGGALKIKTIRDFINASLPKNYGSVSRIGDYVLDFELSNEHTQVYWNQQENKGIVYNRQTEGINDVISDIKAGLNIFRKDKRFTEAWNIMDKVKVKYGSLSRFEAIAYSLGAIVLEHYDKVNEFHHVYYISKPVLPVDLYTNLKPLPNSTEIRSKFDPTSMLKPWQDEAPESILITAHTINPGTEHQQKHVLTRLDDEMVVGKGINKLKTAEIKALIIKLRKGQATQYQVTNKKKGELLKMLMELLQKSNNKPRKSKNEKDVLEFLNGIK